ncbi:MAG: class I SAM-dependent methyltransferase [Myxococcota bacterium]
MQQTAQPYANEFVEFWNDTLAEKFERYRDILMNGLSYHSSKPLGELSVTEGSRIVDVGCGWGDTALELARKTGADGYVLGIDCVEQFLQKGREDAQAAGVKNVEFLAADVQTYPFEPDFDLAFSRFGMMFFQNPVAAMKNVHRALKPGGTLMFIVWRSLEENPWMALPKEVVMKFLPQPGDDARTCGPGPFSMANPEVVSKQLEIAGFEDMDFQPTDGPVTIGDSVKNAIDCQLALGPAGEVFREAGEEAEAKRPEIEQALTDALSDYLQDGKVVMPSASWTITATKPR